MLNKHQCITLFGSPLFSLLDFNTPVNEKLPIPAVACFSYILDGDGQQIDPKAGITAYRGNVIVSLCGVTLGHMLTQQGQGRIKTLVVHFHEEHLRTAFIDTKPPHWQEIEAPVSKYVVQMAANNLIENYVSGIMSLFDNQEAVTDELLLLKLKELIVLMLQTDGSAEVLQVMRSLFSEKEFTFKEIIEAHILEPLSVNDMAQLTNRSLSTFKRDFKKIFKEPPATYILNRRIEMVAKMVLTTQEPISTIGYLCGFSSPAHLSRYFKSKYGMSPTQYKLTHTVKD